MSDFYFGNEIILSKGYITSNFPIHNASSLFNRELNKKIKKSIDELIKKSKFENLDNENDEQLKKIIISFFKKKKGNEIESKFIFKIGEIQEKKWLKLIIYIRYHLTFASL